MRRSLILDFPSTNDFRFVVHRIVFSLFNNKVIDLIRLSPEDLYIYLSIGEAAWTKIYYFSVIECYTSLIKRGGITIKNKTYSRRCLTSWCSCYVYCIYVWHTHPYTDTHVSVVCLSECALEFKPVENRIKFFATEFLSLWDLQWIYLIDSCRKRRTWTRRSSSSSSRHKREKFFH